MAFITLRRLRHGAPFVIDSSKILAFWRVEPPYPQDQYTIIELENGKQFEVMDKPDVISEQIEKARGRG